MSAALSLIPDDEDIVDLFSGGGGASEGILWATGRSPTLAVNHDLAAVEMHKRNHPQTKHLYGDVWATNPLVVCRGRRVGLLWASPDCTHHSKAKGGKPRNQKKRSLAYVVVRWARTVKPRVIMLENVEEFAKWGPLDAKGKPIKAKAGRTFRHWRGCLRKAGYEVEMRMLRACDFGAPTTRRRLFIIARCDGQPIAWPKATHGPGLKKAWRTAAECIDWDLPCPSIFGRKKPLRPKTMRRIARGVFRFVIDNPKPFTAPNSNVVGPAVMSNMTNNIPRGVDEPVSTILTGNHKLLVVPTLVQIGYGERKGQKPRSLDLHKPLGTVMARGEKHGLVAAFLAKHNGGHEATGSKLGEPMHTITAKDHHALVTATVARRGEHTDHREAVRSFLTEFRGTSTKESPQLSLEGVSANDDLFIVTIDGEQYEIVDIGMRMLSPRELYRAMGFKDSYVIAPTIWGKTRKRGVFQLRPLNKKEQIACCGNAVCPQMSHALVRANFGGEQSGRRAA